MSTASFDDSRRESGLSASKPDAGAARYRCNPGVMTCAFGEGVALLDAGSNTYFSLDPVGAVVWNAMQGGADTGSSIEDLCDAVVAEFDVARDVCRPDILGLLDDLCAHGLCEAT